GTVYAWGYNEQGQLALNDFTNRFSPTLTSAGRVKQISAGGTHSMALIDIGQVWVSGDNRFGQLGVGDNANRSQWTKTSLTYIKSISAGRRHSVVLSPGGSPLCAGDNTAWQLGFGAALASSNTYRFSNIRQVRSIATGPMADHTLAVRVNGTIIGWG